jgi:glutamate N-acetyltransferase/amino-acid N-acetyltransferase
VQVCKSSAPVGDKSKVDFSGREVRIDIAMNMGESMATVVTNDLSHDYVEENSAYST